MWKIQQAKIKPSDEILLLGLEDGSGCKMLALQAKGLEDAQNLCKKSGYGGMCL